MRDFDQFRPYGRVVHYGAWHLIGPLFLLLILGMLVYLTIATVRRSREYRPAAGRSAAAPAVVAAPPSSEAPTAIVEQNPLDVVKMRYARGEITSEEFQKLKQDLQ